MTLITNKKPKLQLLLLSLLVIGSIALSGSMTVKPVSQDSTALKDKLINLEKQSWEAWKDHDAKFYQDFLSDDHVEIGPDGISTKADVVKLVGSGRCKVTSYSIDGFQCKMLDVNTALLTYHARQQTSCGTFLVPSQAMVSSIYVKHGDKWLNAVYQQSWPAAVSK